MDKDSREDKESVEGVLKKTMKEVFILRHANWNLERDVLTKEAKEKCKTIKEKIGTFEIVVASNFKRTKQTGFLLTGKKPKIDDRAGILALTKEQEKKITELRKIHLLGVVGAIWSIPLLHKSVKEAGEKLILLIKEILSILPENKKALIISHNGTIVAAKKILEKENFDEVTYTFHELEGIIINEKLEVKRVSF